MTRFEKLAEDYRENKRIIEEAEALNADIRAEILEIMDGAEEYRAGNWKATYKPASRTSINGAALKKDHPDIYAAYSSVSTYNQLRIS